MVYTDGYMAHDPGYVRFYAYLSLFSSSMLGLVVSLNLVQVYIFWELVGMCSYLLVGSGMTARQQQMQLRRRCRKPRRRLWPAIGNSGSLLGDGSFEFEVMGDRLQDCSIRIP